MRRPSGENAATRDGIVMAGEHGELPRPLAASQIRRGPVFGGGDDTPPVGRERGGVDLIAMT